LYGAGNVLFRKTAQEAADAHVVWLREDAVGSVVTVGSIGPVVLQGISGVRLVATYRDRKTGIEMTSDTIVMLRSRESGDRLGNVPDYEYSFGVVTATNDDSAARRESVRNFVCGA
ncbi:MAG TPA: hypothetical protein VIW78_08070, partial [Burkholderiales bacterium]